MHEMQKLVCCCRIVYYHFINLTFYRNIKHTLLDLEKCNVGSGTNRNVTECLCGDEIRSLSDMIRIDVVLTRKLHVARFLAPLISAIYNFPSRVTIITFLIPLFVRLIFHFSSIFVELIGFPWISLKSSMVNLA